MNLQLSCPVAVLDLETTGVNLATDRIIEIAIIKVNPDGSKQVKRKLINPEMRIPASSSDIHGITDDMVKDAPVFRVVANEIKQFILNCDLAGYNSNRFDWPLLMEEFLRAGIEFDLSKCRMIDVQKIFHVMEPRTLSAAYKFYCDRILENAHSAEVDASATWDILVAQMNRYSQLGHSMETVAQFLKEEPIVDFARRFVFENGVEIFNFGKHKGRPVADVLRQEPQYYDWMMKGEFPLHTKLKLTELFNRTLLRKEK